MRRRLAVAAFLAFANVAVAQEPEPQPTPVAAPAPSRRGIYGGLDLGYHRPDGTFYGGNLEPGFCFNLHGGYRFGPFFALESGIYEGLSHVKGSAAGSSAGTVELGTLDARFFLPLPGAIEPDLLVGYTLAAGSSNKEGGTTATYVGPSTNLGFGFRWSIDRNLFLDADYRHMFVRLTKARITGSGAPGIDGTYSLARQFHGDDDAVLFGGGIQF